MSLRMWRIKGLPHPFVTHTHEPCQLDHLGNWLQCGPGQRLSPGRHTGWVPTRVWDSDSPAPGTAVAWPAQGGGDAFFSTRSALVGGFWCGAGRFAGSGLLLVHVIN